jgi:hypothetical protein
VLSNYGFTCAVTGQRFRHGKTIEAEAAHIIGKDVPAWRQICISGLHIRFEESERGTGHI